MDIQIKVREGRKVMAGTVEKWKDYEEVVVEGGEELRELVKTIDEYEARVLGKWKHLRRAVDLESGAGNGRLFSSGGFCINS